MATGVCKPGSKDCHGLTFHAYGVDQTSGEAFPLAFRFADGTVTDTWSYAPGRPPEVRDGRMVLSMSEGPGGESGGSKRETSFELDRSARELVAVEPL